MRMTKIVKKSVKMLLIKNVSCPKISESQSNYSFRTLVLWQKNFISPWFKTLILFLLLLKFLMTLNCLAIYLLL